MNQKKPEIEFNIDTLIPLIEKIYVDLRPAEWVIDSESPHGGYFEERTITPFKNPIKKESKRSPWAHDYSSTAEKHGIIACGKGFLTFVPVGDGSMEPEDLFWLSMYNYSYDGFIPINPEEIVATARSINEENPEFDCIPITIDYIDEPDSFVDDEKSFVFEFIYQAISRALSDAIFDKTMNH